MSDFYGDPRAPWAAADCALLQGGNRFREICRERGGSPVGYAAFPVPAGWEVRGLFHTKGERGRRVPNHVRIGQPGERAPECGRDEGEICLRGHCPGVIEIPPNSFDVARCPECGWEDEH